MSPPHDARLELEPSGPVSRVDLLAAFVIGRMLASTDGRTRRLAMSALDPLERARVARRVQAALDDARHAAPLFDEHDQRRLALLDVLNRMPPYARIADVVLVRAMVEALGAERSSERGDPAIPTSAGRWSRTISALVVVLGLLLTIPAYLFLRPVPYAELESSETPSRAAYRSGGRPLHDARIRAAFATALPGLSVAAARAAREGSDVGPAFETLRAELADDSLELALGSFPTDALRRLVTTFVKHVAGEATDEDLRAAISRLNATLVRAGLGYRVETIDLNSSSVGITTFEVEAVERRTVGDQRVSLLRATRLDHLDARYASFGVIERDAPFLVLPIDLADRDATLVFLPLLDEPPSFPLISAGTSVSRYPFLAPLHEAARTAIVRDLVRGGCGRAVEATERLLAQRRALVVQWAGILAARGVQLVPPDHYRLDIEQLRRYAATNPRFHAIEAVYDELGEARHARAFRCAREHVLDAHVPAMEQRWVDARASGPLPVPPSVLDLADTRLPGEEAGFAMQNTVRSVRAALASLERSPGTTGIMLTHLLRCWTDGGSCLRFDEDAARIVFAELARELGVPNVGNLRSIGSARIAELYTDLVSRPPSTLVRAATSTRTRLFGPR